MEGVTHPKETNVAQSRWPDTPSQRHEGAERREARMDDSSGARVAPGRASEPGLKDAEPMTSRLRAAIRPDIHERFIAVVARADAKWGKREKS
jgi:hypothetical protein